MKNYIHVGKLDDVDEIESKSIRINKPLINDDEQEITSTNDLFEIFQNLDADKEDPSTHLTTIDFNTDLTHEEISNIVPLQLLTSFKVAGALPCLLARTIKRHKVSLNRQGRIEKKDMVIGRAEQETEKQTGVFGKILGKIKSNKNE